MADGRPPYYALRIRAIQALLVEKGVLTQEDIQNQIDYIESRTPALGARMVAKAWVDQQEELQMLLGFWRQCFGEIPDNSPIS